MQEAVTNYARVYDARLSAEPPSKLQEIYLKEMTHKDCVHCSLPSEFLGTTDFDKIGWCRDCGEFVWCAESVYDVGCDAFDER